MALSIFGSRGRTTTDFLALTAAVLFAVEWRGEARAAVAALRDTPPELLTVAEASGYTKTARHADVVALLDRIATASPLARRASTGTTGEGREIPLLIMSDPPVARAAEARAAAAKLGDGRLTVLVIGNIHAGEVDGKEALPMLARDLLGLGGGAAAPGGAAVSGGADVPSAASELLKKVVVVFAPIYNADGNERFGNHRPTQNGPALMGIRENANGRDLNRDFIKVEEAETAALVRFFNEWDPAVFMDCHITNGSLHRYLVTYAGPKGPATEAGLERLSRERMLPEIGAAFTKITGWNAFWYGSFGNAFAEEATKREQWGTFPAEARFGTTYVGLRNRLSILVETYTYAPFKDRVEGTRAFVRSALEWTAANAELVRGTLAAADAARPAKLAMRTKATPWPEKVKILGYEERIEGGRPVSTGVERTYECELWDRFEATREVDLPGGGKGGYMIPLPRGNGATAKGAKNTKEAPEARDSPAAQGRPAAARAGDEASERAAVEKIVAKLRQHGIEVRPMTRAWEGEVSVPVVKTIEQASRAFQGHVLAKVDVERVKRRVKVEGQGSGGGAAAPRGVGEPGGADVPSAQTVCWFVPLDQPLGRLAAYLLEPECEDGLAAWNAYDQWLKVGGEVGVWGVATWP
ncbi:MAG: M14 family zinc carboxypeptidase [Phycisphaerales bacterium]